MKTSKFKGFVGLFVVCLLLVSTFVLVAEKKVFATTPPVTWNPNDKGSNVTLSNGNLTMTGSSGFTDGGVRATKGVSSGKWYWEITLISGEQIDVGIANTSASLSALNHNENARYYYSNYYAGYKYPECILYGTKFSINDIIGVALDMDQGTLEFYRNGISQGISHTDIKSMGIVYPYSHNDYGTGIYSVTANFGATAFAYSVPTGYTAFNEVLTSPSNLLATSDSGQVSLTWTEVNGATSYNIKKATIAGGPYETIASSVTLPNYTDTSVTNGTTYYYVVSAVSVDGESENSNEVSATPTATTTPTGSDALLRIFTTDGKEIEFELTGTEVANFITWYQTNGNPMPYYMFEKSYNKGPFTSRKVYVAFDKIVNFEVMEY